MRRLRGPWWPGWVALTGTPGVGKSSVVAALPPRLGGIELAKLASELGTAAGRGRRRAVIDLDRTVRAARPRREVPTIVAGHLAHFLPARTVVVLRCHPIELALRLVRARRGTPAERYANVVCEAIGLVTWEASVPGRKVIEVDTTGRTVEEVARQVVRALASTASRSTPRVEWLTDRTVTDYLLRGVP